MVVRKDCTREFWEGNIHCLKLTLLPRGGPEPALRPCPSGLTHKGGDRTHLKVDSIFYLDSSTCKQEQVTPPFTSVVIERHLRYPEE